MNYMKSFISTLFVFFVCIFARQACGQTIPDWGQPIHGIQLSITLSTNVVVAGSSILVQCLATNASTDNVYFFLTDPRAMYEASLIADSGKVYEINDPTSIDVGMNTSGGIKPGKSFERSLPLQIDKSMEQGHYKFRVKQTFFFPSQHPDYTNLVSNLLDVQIK